MKPITQDKTVHRLALVGAFFFLGHGLYGQGTSPTPGYLDRFLEIREEFYDPANGYFSADGAPYHSVETLIVEAPDQGHESTSELYSYWVWLEAMYGKLTGDWQPLNNVWATMEEHIIPSPEDQPNTADYNPNDPADYIPEFLLPEGYPAPISFSIPVGQDPVSPDLFSTYGTHEIYGMHWLLDCDNFYGYGKRGDGVSTPSYINTFQRGEQESTWETVPHPSWEDFSFGSDNGFLPLFIDDPNGYARQWRYTNAPDADARAVQAMYWAYLWTKEQGLDPKTTIPIDKAVKMGDYLRLAMFDKYFKPLGTQNPQAPGGQGYESAHYLMSWYYSWGGKVPVEGENFGWSWRIGSSACHFGYQNPVAAWVLSNVDDFKPASANGVRDWGLSFDRQMEFYEYLQSPQGPIAGGATNSWNGDYSPHPAGRSTFYGMAFDENPVYEDPGSNTWPGFQGWSVERLAELYYLNNDARAKSILDKWVPWLLGEIQLIDSDDFMIPARFEWTGQPDTWTGSPTANSGLRVEVVEYGRDLGVAASFARTLTYYAAATEKHDVLNLEARDMAKEILDRMWTSYRDDKGLSSPESRADYRRFFEQEVFIPGGFSGTMANGDVIQPGVNFLDIRSQYRNDPMFPALEAAYQGGQDFVVNYHRSWAQIEIALANAEFGIFFGDSAINKRPTVTITSPQDGDKFNQEPIDITITADASDEDGTVLSVEFFQNGTSLGIDTLAPYEAIFENVTHGTYNLSAVATDDLGGSATDEITITVGNSVPLLAFTADPVSGSAPLVVTFDASATTDADGDTLTFHWTFGDGSVATGPVVQNTYDTTGTFTATITVTDGNGGIATDSISIEVFDLECDLATVYEVPKATSLPSINNVSFDFVYVLGTGGPDLSNVTNFTINWANESWGTGLWQMSIQTNNGVPSWWNDMRQVSSNTFAQSSPTLTFTGSGFPGLDGMYYINLDGDNVVLVAATGEYAIYFSNSATPPTGCKPANARLGEKQDVPGIAGIRVHPNPSNGSFFLFIEDVENVDEIAVYNAVGVRVRGVEIPSPGDQLVQFGNELMPGMYYLTIHKQGKVTTHKLIKN